MSKMQRAGLDTGCPAFHGFGALPWSSSTRVSFHAAAALLILLMCATPVYAQTSKEPVVLVSAVVGTGIADWWSTSICLRAGTCREANPALQWAVTSGELAFGLTKAVSTVLIAYLVDWLYDHGHRRWARVVGIGASVTWATAAVLNLRYAPERMP